MTKIIQQRIMGSKNHTSASTCTALRGMSFLGYVSMDPKQSKRHTYSAIFDTITRNETLLTTKSEVVAILCEQNYSSANPEMD